MKTLHKLQSGVATIELALLLTPLLLLTFGITEYGRAMYQYNTLAKSVRAGTRYLSQFEAGANFAQARCLVVYGNTGCNGPTLVPGLTATEAMVPIADASNDAAMKNQPVSANGATLGTANLVRVSVVGYQFQSAVAGFVPLNFSFGPISVTLMQVLI